MFQKVSANLINPIPTDVFGLRNLLLGLAVKLSSSFLFLGTELLFIDLKLGTHTK